MINFVIYLDTVVYAALYHKRKAQPKGTINLSQEEFEEYYQLVIKDIEEEMSIANGFTYEIKQQGEPTYSLSLATEADKELLRKTVFSYNPQTKTFSTDADLQGLSLKSVHVYPQSIGKTIVPSGYEKSLNISIDNKKSGDFEPGL